MFKNVGKKIMTLVTVICIIGFVLSAVAGFVLFYYLGDITDNIVLSIASGVVAAVVLSFLFWIASFAMYGYGKLIDNSDKLVKIGEQLLARDSEKPEEITVAVETAEASPEATADNSTWICEKCGSAVSADYDHCPLCEIVVKEENK